MVFTLIPQDSDATMLMELQFHVLDVRSVKLKPKLIHGMDIIQHTQEYPLLVPLQPTPTELLYQLTSTTKPLLP